MAWEFCYGTTMYGLYKGFPEREGKWDILRGLSDTVAVITYLFASLQCSWLHLKHIFCTLNGVSELKL